MRDVLIAATAAAGGFVLLALVVLIFRPRRPGYKLRLMLEVERDRERDRGDTGPEQRSDS